MVRIDGVIKFDRVTWKLVVGNLGEGNMMIVSGIANKNNNKTLNKYKN